MSLPEIVSREQWRAARGELLVKLDLFEGRRQLVVHHFMFAPERDAGCRS